MKVRPVVAIPLLSVLFSGPATADEVSPSRAPRPATDEKEIFEHALGTKAPESTRRTPLVLGGVGLSTLHGVDASVVAFSGEVEVGVLRFLSAQARIDLPLA